MIRFFMGFLTGVIVMILVLVFVLPTLNKYARGKAAEKLEPPVLPTADAEYDWTLTALDGSEASFEQYKGKTTVLTVWDPDCAICLAELPYLQVLFDKLKDDDIAFVAVSVKREPKLTQILEENGVSFPVFTYTEENERPEIYKVGTVPATFVLSPQGKVVLRYKGGARWDDDSFVRYLREVSLMATSESVDPEKAVREE